jgi:alpha-mannosidase
MLSAPAALVVVEDEGDTWGHGLSSYRKELGRPALQETRVMEDGPVCKKVRQKAVWGKSVIWLDIVFYRDLGATELRFRINWQETRQMLKFEFPLALQNPFLIAKTAGGQSVRQIDGKEVPAQDWLAVQGSLSGKPYAFGLVNDGTYGYDSLGSLLRADLLRSGYYGQHDPVQPVDKEYEPLLDQGWMEKRFWLMAGPGGHEGLELQRRCEELQQPVRAVLDSAHPGTAAWEGSLLEVGPENVLATAVKPAEDGKGLILRVQETAGRNTKAVITAGKGKAFRVSLKAWEIKTVRILGGRLLETDALERPLKKTGR